MSKGGVDARVQGSMPRPYKVNIRFKSLTDAEWEQVYAVMASEATYAARLLSGEMPAAIENAFAVAGAPLFPSAEKDLVTDCSCPDWANPCKHVAAVFYLLGERFDADPFLMFVLRGRGGDEVTAALRALRGATADDAVDAADEVPEPAVPLLAGPAETFWRSAPSALTPGFGFDPPLLDALPVKSLGPPPFWSDQQRPFAAVMEDLYRAVSTLARDLAFGDTGSAAGG